MRLFEPGGGELLGYSTRLAAGRDIHELLHHSHPDGRPYARDECPIMQTLRAGGSISGQNEVLWRAGKEPFPVQISLRAVKDGPVLKGAVLTFTDMTETRAAEESLRQAVQTRDEVLAVVSHDLRNPVGTIFSAASLLLELEIAPEKRREHLESVKRSAERMNRLIQDLLDVARMEAGRISGRSPPSSRSRSYWTRLRGRTGEKPRRGAYESGSRSARKPKWDGEIAIDFSRSCPTSWEMPSGSHLPGRTW